MKYVQLFFVTFHFKNADLLNSYVKAGNCKRKRVLLLSVTNVASNETLGTYFTKLKFYSKNFSSAKIKLIFSVLAQNFELDVKYSCWQTHTKIHAGFQQLGAKIQT